MDTDVRETALKPEARVNKPLAAEGAATEHMGLNQAKQTIDPYCASCEDCIQHRILNPVCLHNSCCTLANCFLEDDGREGSKGSAEPNVLASQVM